MKPIIMDFSGIYREENFLKEEEALWLDFRKLQEVKLLLHPGSGGRDQRKNPKSAFSGNPFSGFR